MRLAMNILIGNIMRVQVNIWKSLIWKRRWILDLFLQMEKTSSDFETYFGEGFQTMEDQFNSMYDGYESMLPDNL